MQNKQVPSKRGGAGYRGIIKFFLFIFLVTLGFEMSTRHYRVFKPNSPH